MKRIKTLAVLLLVSVLCTSTWARTWTSKDGNFTLEAELVEFKEGKAFLKRSDGQVIGVPLEKLSEADQQFLKEQGTDPPSDVKQQDPSSVKSISVEEALQKQISYQFVETPLRNVVANLAKQTGVNIYISNRALAEFGLSTDSPVTTHAEKVELRTALSEILKPLELQYVPLSEVIVITSQEHAEMMLSTKAYQVTRPMNADDLIREITRLFSPNSWSDVGGPGSIQPLSIGVLVICQRDDVHQQIMNHYKDLLRPLTKQAARGKQKAPVDKDPLARVVKVQFLDTPLSDATTYLAKANGLRITLDQRSLNDVGLDGSVPVTINLTNVSLTTALDLMLEPLSLTWYEEKGKVEITSPEVAEMKLFAVSYPLGAMAGPGGLLEWKEIISSTVAPNSWDEVGGPGRITPTQRGTLEISQSYHVHRQITELLNAIATMKQ